MILNLIKYKVGAIATLILVVLVLSFSASYYHFSSKILHLTTTASIAERQKTLVQQVAKNLLLIEKAKINGVVPPDIFVQLKDHYTLFNTTIIALSAGGLSIDLLGEPFRIEPIVSSGGLESLAAAMDIWISYQEKIEQVIGQGELVDKVTLKQAVSFSTANETKLLDLMDDLTQSLSLGAKGAMGTLYKLQILGVVLALMLFLLFTSYSGLRLRRSEGNADQSAVRLASMTREIQYFLHKNGGAVFSLKNRDILTGENISSFENLLHKKDLKGKHLIDVLSPFLSNVELKALISYLDLVFDEYADAKLVDSKNPLRHLKIAVKSSRGRTINRHLSFEFALQHQQPGRRSVLVTVRDITRDYGLTQQLRDALYHSKLAANMLAGLSYDNTEVEKFFTTGKARLLELKNRLFCLEYASRSQNVYEPIYKLIEALIQDAAHLHQPLFIDAAKSLRKKLNKLEQQDTKGTYDAKLHECQAACSELDCAVNESCTMFKKCTSDTMPEMAEFDANKQDVAQAKSQYG